MFEAERCCCVLCLRCGGAAPKRPLKHPQHSKMAVVRCAVLAAGVAMLAATSSALTPSKELARGWGDDIAWVEHAVARKIAKKSGRPVMYVVHKTWCGACKNLKPKFAASEEIAKLSAEFVMVNVQDSEEPAGDQFKPDGGYIPRILFAGSSGRVDPSVINTVGNPKYKYFYSDAESIVASMKRVTKRSQSILMMQRCSTHASQRAPHPPRQPSAPQPSTASRPRKGGHRAPRNPQT